MKLPSAVVGQNAMAAKEAARSTTVKSPTQSLLEVVFVAVLFLLAARDPLGMLAARKAAWQWPRDLSLPLVSAVAGVLLTRSWSRLEDRHRLRLAIRYSWPAIATVLVAALSTRWSLDVQRSINDVSWLLASTCLAVGISISFHYDRIMDALAFVMGGLLAVSGILAQSAMYRSEESFWVGVYGNRNGLGAIAALSVPVFWHLPVHADGSRIQGSTRRVLAVLLSALSWTTVVKTHSRTSLAVAALLTGLCMCLTVFRWLQRRKLSSRPNFKRVLLIAVCAIGGVGGLTRFVAIAPVDRTLNMRTDMWSTLLPVANRRWSHGYGYGGFWSGERGYLLAAQFRSGAGPALTSAHNGFLQEYLAIGVLGVVFSFILFALCIVRFFPQLTRTAGVHGVSSLEEPMAVIRYPNRVPDLCLALTVGILLLNITEAMLSSPLSLPWFLLVLIASYPAVRRKQAITLIEVRLRHATRIASQSSTPTKVVAGVALVTVLFAAVSLTTKAPYDTALVADDFAKAQKHFEIADDAPTREALNRLGLVYDARRDLRLAFGLDDVRVRDLLEWAVTSGDDDAVSLKRFLPIYRSVIAQIDKAGR